MLKISDLPNGVIIWYKGTILGITGATLHEQYYDYYCKKIYGNDLDYELEERNIENDKDNK